MESQLEARLLTRPAIFRKPHAPAWVSAFATNGLELINDASAGVGSQIEAVFAPPWPWLPVVVYRQQGLVTSQIVDSNVPTTGVFGISANLTHDHTLSVGSNVSGVAPPLGFRYSTTAQGVRRLLLADEGTLPPIQQTTTLVETLDFTLTQAGNAGYTITGGLHFRGMGFAVAAVYPAMPQVTEVDPGTSVGWNTSHSGGLATFRLTATTLFPDGLPLFPTGVETQLIYGSTLTTEMGPASDANSQITISVHYEAYFFV